MTRVLIAVALLVPAAAPVPAPQQICVPAPRRTLPHGHFDRVDKWQNDERTVA